MFYLHQRFEIIDGAFSKEVRKTTIGSKSDFNVLMNPKVVGSSPTVGKTF